MVKNPSVSSSLRERSRSRASRSFIRRASSICQSYEGADLAELLEDAISNIHGEITEYEVDEELTEEDDSIPADPNVRNFSYTVVDDQIYYMLQNRKSRKARHPQPCLRCWMRSPASGKATAALQAILPERYEVIDNPPPHG